MPDSGEATHQASKQVTQPARPHTSTCLSNYDLTESCHPPEEKWGGVARGRLTCFLSSHFPIGFAPSPFISGPTSVPSAQETYCDVLEMSLSIESV